MAYTKNTSFGAKDVLASGNPNKIVKGSELDTEFDEIATESAKAVEKAANNTLSGNNTFSGNNDFPAAASGLTRGSSEVIVASDIGTTVQGYDADTAKTDTAGDWTAQQRFTEATLTDGANIAWNLDTQQEATVTLAGNRTLDNPTNQNAGGWYHLRVVQDATGSRTLSYGTDYKFGDAGEPSLSTAANSEDVLAFRSNGTKMQFMGYVTGVQA